MVRFNLVLTLLFLSLLAGCIRDQPSEASVGTPTQDEWSILGAAAVSDPYGDLNEFGGPGNDGIDIAGVVTQELPSGLQWTLTMYGKVHPPDSRFHCKIETTSGEAIARAALYKGKPSPAGAQVSVADTTVTLQVSNDDFLMSVEPQQVLSECRTVLTSTSGDLASDYSEVHAVDLQVEHVVESNAVGPFSKRTVVLHDSTCDATAFTPTGDGAGRAEYGKCPLADLAEVAIWQDASQLILEFSLHDEIDHSSTIIQTSYAIAGEGHFQRYASIWYRHHDERAIKDPGNHDLDFSRPDANTVQIRVPWNLLSDREREPIELTFIVRSQADHTTYMDEANVAYSIE